MKNLHRRAAAQPANFACRGSMRRSLPAIWAICAAWLALALPAWPAAGAAQGAKQATAKPVAQPKRIQPRDGYWRWDMGATQSSATCMPGLAKSLRQLLPQERGEQVRFGKPFHPAQLVQHQAVRWQQPGPNHFVATAQGVQVQGLALPLDVHYELHVLSPTQMRGLGRVQMPLLQSCAISAPFSFERQAKAPGGSARR
ncbi:MAG: hypothetical protein Q4A97_12630 [Comamonadaceae bacterium]|nr:hypothetical protein [Comamonadaceae bacterium]